MSSPHWLHVYWCAMPPTIPAHSSAGVRVLRTITQRAIRQLKYDIEAFDCDHVYIVGKAQTTGWRLIVQADRPIVYHTPVDMEFSYRLQFLMRILRQGDQYNEQKLLRRDSKGILTAHRGAGQTIHDHPEHPLGPTVQELEGG